MADRGGLGGVPVTGLIAVLVAIIGAILWKGVPLEVQRPGVSAPIPYQELGLQDVDARLWEDPFAAVSRAIESKAVPDERRLLPKVCERVRQRVKGNVKLLVLGVMVSKAPYADGEEQRRRIRYAVVSALSVAHFVPENAEHLGYLRWSSDSTIPFELFRRKNKSALGFDLVAMVLWLEDEAFSSVHAKGAQMPGGSPTPVLRLNQLALDLKSACSTQTDVLDNASYQFQVVGPAQSSSLKSMIDEMEREPDIEAQIAYTGRPRLTHVEFYSPFATASETELLRRRRVDEPAAPDAQKRGPCRASPREPDCTLHRFFATKGLRFFQTTSSDDRLVNALVDELDLRGVPVRTASSKAHHVALVSEWDTYYGRMLPSAFLRAAGIERVCETDLSETQPFAERGAMRSAVSCGSAICAGWMVSRRAGPRRRRRPRRNPRRAARSRWSGPTVPSSSTTCAAWRRRSKTRTHGCSARGWERSVQWACWAATCTTRSWCCVRCARAFRGRCSSPPISMRAC